MIGYGANPPNPRWLGGAEGAAGAPKMLSIGLHCRLVGRPARTAALERFLDHVQAHDKVWIARRADIARHWVEQFPPGAALRR